LDDWTPYSDIHPRERNSKCSTYHQWCTLPTRRALVTYSPHTLSRYIHLDLPRDIFHSLARFIHSAHTLQFETVTWTHNTSPTSSTCDLCDLCNAHDAQVEQHVLFHCTHPHVVSFRRTYKRKKEKEKGKGKAPKDLCFPISFCRLKQCVCFSGPGKQLSYISFMH